MSRIVRGDASGSTLRNGGGGLKFWRWPATRRREVKPAKKLAEACGKSSARRTMARSWRGHFISRGGVAALLARYINHAASARGRVMIMVRSMVV